MQINAFCVAYLNPTSTATGPKALQAEATRVTDNQAAQQLNEARAACFNASIADPSALPDGSAPPFIQAQTSIGIDFGLL
ncbi:MAG: hypothetical protein ACREX8_19640, partial [Gammaproteobacteria bacterium]